jgi:hypothetical protein
VDLNIWVAALLAERAGRRDTVVQRIIGALRRGDSPLGPVQVIISWAMLDRLRYTLVQRLGADPAAVEIYVQTIAPIARRGPVGTAPLLVLGGTGVLALRDPEDAGVLETALAGQADLLVTRNHRDFLPRDAEVVEPDTVTRITGPTGAALLIATPDRMLQWMAAGEISASS